MTTRSVADLRRSVDDMDKVILNALGERARLAREIVAAKSEESGPIRDEEREAALLKHRSVYGEQLGLDPAFVGAHHLARFVLIAMLLPFVARGIFGKAAYAGAKPAPAKKKTVRKRKKKQP